LLADTDVAVFATFTALALTGIADFGGSMPGRATATALAALAGIALTALGTWASTEPLAVQVAVMFAAAATVTYSTVLGGYAAAGAVAVTLFYLVAAGSPAPLPHLPDRLAGVIIGGALAVGAGAWLWPARSAPTVETKLADALDHLARRLRDPACRPAGGPGVRQVIDSLEARPSAPTGPARAALYLVNDLERLGRLTDRLDRSNDPGASSERTTAGAILSGCAEALRSGHAEAVPAAPSPVLHGYDLPDRLLAVTSSAAVHCAAVLSATSPSVAATVDHARPRLLAHLSLRSVHARDALRTGVGLAAACAVAGGFGLAHGFWVAFATLTVLRSSLRVTARRVGAAVAGTVGGCAASFVVVDAVGAHTALYAALLPVVIALAIAANAGIGFLAGQVGFTVAIVVLFNLLVPAGWHIGILRVQDVAAGALTGVIVGALAWPRGARAELPIVVADLADRAGAYLAATVRALAHGATRPDMSDDLDGVRQPALVAAVRADGTFAQYLAEAPEPDEAFAWAAAAAAAHRLWYAADLLRTSDARPTADPDALDAAADRILAPSRHRGNTQGRPHPNDPLLDWLDDLARPPPHHTPRPSHDNPRHLPTPPRCGHVHLHRAPCRRRRSAAPARTTGPPLRRLQPRPSRRRPHPRHRYRHRGPAPRRAPARSRRNARHRADPPHSPPVLSRGLSPISTRRAPRGRQG
jgi:uncharacterized membrane protein YccC